MALRWVPQGSGRANVSSGSIAGARCSGARLCSQPYSWHVQSTDRHSGAGYRTQRSISQGVRHHDLRPEGSTCSLRNKVVVYSVESERGTGFAIKSSWRPFRLIITGLARYMVRCMPHVSHRGVCAQNHSGSSRTVCSSAYKHRDIRHDISPHVYRMWRQVLLLPID